MLLTLAIVPNTWAGQGHANITRPMQNRGFPNKQLQLYIGGIGKC